MPKLTTIEAHLSLAELEQGYRNCQDLTEKTHWQVVWLLATSKRVAEVAAITTFSSGWVREIARRYNQKGPSAIADRRRDLPGVKPLLDQTLQAELDQLLQQPPAEGGQWTGPRVAEWIAQRLGHKIHRQQGWAYLKRLDYTAQIPRPTHKRADKAAQIEFKKNWLTK